MKLNYYMDCELEYYIDVIDNVLDFYYDKVEMLENLKHKFLNELLSRGRD